MVNEIMTLDDLRKAREHVPPLQRKTKRPMQASRVRLDIEQLREQREIDKINDAEAYYNELFTS